MQYASFYRGCNVLPELWALVLGRQQHGQVHHFLVKLLPQAGQSRRMNRLMPSAASSVHSIASSAGPRKRMHIRTASAP